MITYMSISGEASCNGLYSSREGQTLVLRAGGASLTLTESAVIFLCIFSVNKDSLCSLPSWLRHGKVWQSLDLKLKLEISQSQVSDEYPNCNSLLLFSSNQTQSAPRSSLAPGNQPMGLYLYTEGEKKWTWVIQGGHLVEISQCKGVFFHLE